MTSTYLVPVCPACNHSYDDGDFEKAECDLYAIAPNEEMVHIKCPECKTMFWCEGSYTPQYRTAIDGDDLQ